MAGWGIHIEEPLDTVIHVCADNMCLLASHVCVLWVVYDLSDLGVAYNSYYQLLSVTIFMTSLT